MREEVRGAAIGDWETVERWVPVKEVTPAGSGINVSSIRCVSQMIMKSIREESAITYFVFDMKI